MSFGSILPLWAPTLLPALAGLSTHKTQVRGGGAGGGGGRHAHGYHALVQAAVLSIRRCLGLVLPSGLATGRLSVNFKLCSANRGKP